MRTMVKGGVAVPLIPCVIWIEPTDWQTCRLHRVNIGRLGQAAVHAEVARLLAGTNQIPDASRNVKKREVKG